MRGTPSTSLHQPTNHGNVSSPQLVLLVLNDAILCNVGTAHGNIAGLDPHNGHELNLAVVCGVNDVVVK